MSEQVCLSPIIDNEARAHGAANAPEKAVPPAPMSPAVSAPAIPLPTIPANVANSNDSGDCADIWAGRAHLFCRTGIFHCHEDSPAVLTRAELSLLKVFYDRPGQILDRDQLSELALGRKWQPWNRGIDNHVSHLRRKISGNQMDPDLIRTIRGRGYVYLP